MRWRVLILHGHRSPQPVRARVCVTERLGGSRGSSSPRGGGVAKVIGSHAVFNHSIYSLEILTF